MVCGRTGSGRAGGERSRDSQIFWVTLHLWVCHLKCSLCLLALPNESLGYTALTDVCLVLFSKTKSYSLFGQKSSFVSPKNLTPDWASKDIKISFIIEECFARVNKCLAHMSFNIKVQKLIGIIIAHKHYHQTPDM